MPGESESEVAQLCLTLCNPVDGSLPGSSIHRIFQARVLEWVAISFSRGSSQPRDWTRVSHIVGRRFTVWATREVTENPLVGLESSGGMRSASADVNWSGLGLGQVSPKFRNLRKMNLAGKGQIVFFSSFIEDRYFYF